MTLIRFIFCFALCLSTGLISSSNAAAEESNLGPINGAAESQDEQNADQPDVDPLREKVKLAIDISERRYLDGNLHTPWQILHGMLALRGDYEIKINGEKVSALEWMKQGRTYNRLPWVEKTPYGGRFHTYTQPYHFEGHPNQFLAILTMTDLPLDTTFMARQRNGVVPVTIQEMVDHAKMVVNDVEEQTWTLWALSKYLPSDAEWVNKDGQPWSIERLVQRQTRANFNKAACGGTHGLFALSHARKQHLAVEGNDLTGVWIDADQTIKKHVNIARALQYSDGAFSCGYFAYQDYKKDFAERLSPTGHTLEFLMMAVDDDELQKDWIRKGVEHVADDLINHKKNPIDCGPLYHALSGLVLFLERTEPKPVVVEQVVDGNPMTAPKPASENALVPLVAPKPEVTIRQASLPDAGSGAE
ncbi:MAG: hypothetical protein HUJ26_13325 [Planctomycetaceae bacterium]|nr:hypothetical protein [Planctomycetaceae bacterium]